MIEDGIDDVPPTATERRSCGYGFRKRATSCTKVLMDYVHVKMNRSSLRKRQRKSGFGLGRGLQSMVLYRRRIIHLFEKSFTIRGDHLKWDTSLYGILEVILEQWQNR